MRVWCVSGLLLHGCDMPRARLVWCLANLCVEAVCERHISTRALCVGLACGIAARFGA